MHTCSLALVNPFTKQLYGCKALLHTLVKYGFVEFIFTSAYFFSLSLSSFFLFATQEKCNIMQFRLRLKRFRLRNRYRYQWFRPILSADTEFRSDTNGACWSSKMAHKIFCHLTKSYRQQALRAYCSNLYNVKKRPRTWPPKTIYEKPSEFSTVMAMDISQGMKWRPSWWTSVSLSLS